MADVDKGAYTNPFEDGETRVYDIVNDYDWTTAPAGSKLREQTPNAYVTAYKMEFSQLQQFIDGYINIASSSARAEKLGTNPGLQFYKDMYSSGSVLADINFPFFDDNIRGFTSEYENTFSPIRQRAGTFLFGDAIETSNKYLYQVVELTKILVKKPAGGGGTSAVPNVPLPQSNELQGDLSGPAYQDSRSSYFNSPYSMHTPGMVT